MTPDGARRNRQARARHAARRRAPAAPRARFAPVEGAGSIDRGRRPALARLDVDSDGLDMLDRRYLS